MSVADKITRLTTARDNIRTVLSSKGINASENGFEDFADDIRNIPSDITIEPLNVTENGTYIAPSGKAYSPITAKIRRGLPINISTHINSQTGKWERPAGWPDLDSITLGQDMDIDELYMTYDLSRTEGWGWIGLGATTTGNVDWTVERGHLSDGTFVTDEAFTIASNDFFRQTLDNTKGNIQLWRMRGYRITNYGFVPNSSITSNNFANNLQPCVEVVGRLGFVTSLMYSRGTLGTSKCTGTVWLERFMVDINTGAIIGMNDVFDQCYSLQDIDVSSWDTSSVANMSYMFNQCYSLQNIDVSGWDTSSVTSMGGMFSQCHSLQGIDVNNWDTGSVISMNYMFNQCYNLQGIDVSGWDTSSVTNMGGMFFQCYNLQGIDVSGWDTSSVTDMSYMFNQCHNLQGIDVSGWDTSSVTDMSYMFNQCYSLQSVNVNNWDTGAVTDMNSMFQQCYNLQSIDMSNWDTKAVTKMGGIFSECYTLQSVDMSNWDAGAVTNMSGIFNQCYNLQSVNAAGVNITKLINNTPYLNLASLVTLYPFVISTNQSFSSATKLSIDSLIRIINSLPEVTTTRTLALGQTNKLKLTAEQIAIATEKGWTVA